MRTRSLLSGGIVALLTTGCTLNSPIDPSNLFGSLGSALGRIQQDITDALADPLGNKPFPVLLGGDSERIFYATNLGDIRINFPGKTPDLIIPGLLGPSNLYQYRDDKAQLVRPLVLGGAFTGLATDGDLVAYVAWSIGDEVPTNRLMLGGTFVAGDQPIFEARADEALLSSDVRVNQGRVLYARTDGESATQALFVHDRAAASTTPIASAGYFSAFDLNAGRLAYAATGDDGKTRVVLRDLLSSEEKTLAETSGTSAVYLTDNHAVWDEYQSDGVYRVVAYNVAEGVTKVWRDAAGGGLKGASDTHFVVETVRSKGASKPERVTITLYSVDGEERVLADFRAGLLAGQARIAGNRVVFVNPERRIVVVPLSGEGRFNFRPF